MLFSLSMTLYILVSIPAILDMLILICFCIRMMYVTLREDVDRGVMHREWMRGFHFAHHCIAPFSYAHYLIDTLERICT